MSVHNIQRARIAQLVEHITDTDGVLGSNPSARTLNGMVGQGEVGRGTMGS